MQTTTLFVCILEIILTKLDSAHLAFKESFFLGSRGPVDARCLILFTHIKSGVFVKRQALHSLHYTHRNRVIHLIRGKNKITIQ